jgi:hypothetical protein
MAVYSIDMTDSADMKDADKSIQDDNRVAADEGFKALQEEARNLFAIQYSLSFIMCKQSSTIKFGFVVADCFTFC